MERKLQERMIGAGVLVAVLVVFGPMILDGDVPPSGTASLPVQPGGEEVRTQTFRLDQPAPSPRDDAVSADVATAEPKRAAAALPAAAVDQKLQTPPPKPPEPVVGEQQPPEAQPQAATFRATQPPATKPPAAPKPLPEKTRAVQETGSPGAAAAGGRWLVQVGAFGQKVNAERLVSRLRGAGFEASIGPVSGAGATLYGVRVGPAGSQSDAAALARRLAAAGYPGRLVSQ